MQTCTMSDLPQLPAFHLLLVPEPAVPDQQALRADEQQHIAALLAQYELEEGSLQVGQLTVHCLLVQVPLCSRMHHSNYNHTLHCIVLHGIPFW